MGIRIYIVVGLCAMLSSAYVAAQTNGQYVHGTAYGRTTEQALQEYHVALTRPALIAALGSSEPEVRSLAARKLVEDHAWDAIPLIEAALDAEKVAHIKIGIAFALAEAGDDAGASALQKACDDGSLKMIDRVEAAHYSLFLGRESCVGAIAEALEAKDPAGSNSREIALSLAPSFKHLSNADSELISNLLVRNLTDPDEVTRVAAAAALAGSGRVSAIPQIEAAIGSEKDDSVRVALEANLKILRDQERKGRQ